MNVPTGVLPRVQSETSDLPTVGGLDLDSARRYAHQQGIDLQRRMLAADRKLAIAEQALSDQVGHGELSVEVSMAHAAVRAARERLRT